MLGTTTYGIIGTGDSPESIEVVVNGYGVDATASIALFANTELPTSTVALTREMLQGLVSSASRALAQMRVNEDVKVAYGQVDGEFETSYGTPGTAELPTETSGPAVPPEVPVYIPEPANPYTEEDSPAPEPAENPIPTEENPDA